MKILKKLSRLSFYLFLVVFPFGQLTRIPLSFLSPEIKIYLTDVFLIFTLFFWLIWHWLKKEKIKSPSLTIPVLTFFAVAGISLLLNSFSFTFKEVVISSLYLWRWLLYAGLYFFIYDFIPTDKKQGFFTSANFLKTLVSLGTVFAFFGLIQYLVWPDLRAFEVAHWDPHYFRVVSTFLDPGFSGLLLVLTMILVVEMFKPLACYLLPIVYLAFGLTYSRSSYLAYLAAAGTIAFFRKSTKFFLIALVVLLVTLLALPRQSGGEGVNLGRWVSIEARIRSWRCSLAIFKDHPVLGVGLNTYRYTQRNYGFLSADWRENHAGAGADSSLLFVLATTGVVGLAAYIWLIKRSLKIGRIGLGKKEKTILFASLAAIFAHSWFLNSLFYPWIMAWLWMLLAVFELSKKGSK